MVLDDSVPQNCECVCVCVCVCVSIVLLGMFIVLVNHDSLVSSAQIKLCVLETNARQPWLTYCNTVFLLPFFLHSHIYSCNSISVHVTVYICTHPLQQCILDLMCMQETTELTISGGVVRSWHNDDSLVHGTQRFHFSIYM